MRSGYHARSGVLAAVLLGALAAATSCGSNASQSYITGIGRIDLSGAAAVGIVPSGSASKGAARATGGYEIAKVSAEGAIVVATCYDTEGNAVTSESGAAPQDLFKVDDEYLIVTFWLQTDASGASTKHGYLIRASDGAAYSLDAAGVPQVNAYFKGGPQAARDASGKIYYRKETVATGGICQNDTAVIMISAADPSNLSAQQVSAKSDTVQYFAADSAGNLLYSDGSSVNRLRTRTGAFSSFSSGLYWTGLSGELFFLAGGVISQLSVADAGAVATTAYGALSMSGSPDDFYLFRTSSKILFVYKYQSSSQFFEVYNAAGAPTAITSLPQLTIQAATAYGDYYYIAGQDASLNTRILKVSDSDYSYADLVTAGDYLEVYQLMVNDDGSVVFNAMRSDGKDVMAKVGADGSVSVISESEDLQITDLVRL